MKNLFNSFIAIVGTFCTYWLGGADIVLLVLIGFMATDYITGIMNAILQQKLSSATGFKGLFKKLSIMIMLIIAVLLDKLLNNSTNVFRTLVAYFYIANEGISLLENIANMGVPVPKKVIAVLDQLKAKGDDLNDQGN
jgi:toxin secretion/phage lysis holin